MLREMLRELRLRRERWRSTAGWRSTSWGNAAIDLVITDMMMPVMDGAELATAMREQRDASRHSDRHDDVAAVAMPHHRATCSTPSSESRSRRTYCCEPCVPASRRIPMAMAASRSWIGVPAPVRPRNQTN